MTEHVRLTATPAVGGQVVLRLPPFAPLGRVVRDSVAACAASADFDAPDRDEARFAAGEAFYAMVLLGDGPVTVTADLDDGGLTVAMQAPAARGASWSLETLAGARAVVEPSETHPGFGLTDGVAWIDLHLRRRQPHAC